ncbi:zinc-binding alcohol dehydrogenase family protein [Pedobacter sp. MC2016-05]|uniref:zinc-binding alcohol dehydrogenase family protein n=1 Tax=Pedobacter sp. MC2016-05 TaxID=2994474 RepID=UPI002246245F|nr:zinc-binding alcohol dehydrogenase family protein [Pedobacter sp. MC2016-05]MCX2477018.1 zinc-binding alcohol dehydrogenase family protein [Pedobacter sp. MC2016-05]
MKAIGFKTSLPISEQESFIEFETEKPVPSGRDILVKIMAISVNPVDYKVRQGSAKNKSLDVPKIIGWDASGVIEAVGTEVKHFKAGDEIYYSGDLNRQGCYAEYQLVDERIVGKKPVNQSFPEAAAVPLTLLTAWEIIFERMRINDRDSGKSVLIIGGAGGVGSIAIQLAKKVLGLKVIATASRKESRDWCLLHGADFVVDHNSLIGNVREAGFENVDYILDFVNLNQYWDALIELIKPQGSIGSISDPTADVNLRGMKSKSISFHWELMFTRSMFQTEDMEQQSNILEKAKKLFEKGILKSTINKRFNGFTVENVKAAHELLESGTSIGKIVVLF